MYKRYKRLLFGNTVCYGIQMESLGYAHAKSSCLWCWSVAIISSVRVTETRGWMSTSDLACYVIMNIIILAVNLGLWSKDFFFFFGISLVLKWFKFSSWTLKALQRLCDSVSGWITYVASSCLHQFIFKFLLNNFSFFCLEMSTMCWLSNEHDIADLKQLFHS